MKANLEISFFFDNKQSFRAERTIELPFVPPVGLILVSPASPKWREDVGDHLHSVSSVMWDWRSEEMSVLLEDEVPCFAPADLADELRASGWRIAWSSVPSVAACGVVVPVA